MYCDIVWFELWTLINEQSYMAPDFYQQGKDLGFTMISL